MGTTADLAIVPDRENPEPALRDVYEENARFVWITLQRLGIQPADLGDVAHDVFAVVYRRLHTFDRRSRLTTWLFAICLRVAATHRRRARRQETTTAERILGKLSLEKRAVFTMFEIEDWSCQEIGDVMGVPVGTVYARLHAARMEIQQIVSRTSSLE